MKFKDFQSTCPVFKYFQGLEFRRKKFKYFQGCVGTLEHEAGQQGVALVTLKNGLICQTLE